jgi:O-acetyl-ADP-ribose deacetylase (regulator of RNase III)
MVVMRKKKMNSGIAGQLRKKYPFIFDDYMDLCNKYDDSYDRLGHIAWSSLGNNRYLGNAITQQYYGRDGKCYISYEAINSIMKKADEFALTMKHTTVAMPLIGAGLGGGSWGKIVEIIESSFIYAVPVVYTLDGIIPNN